MLELGRAWVSLGGLRSDRLHDLLVWKSPSEAEDIRTWVLQLQLHAGGSVPRQKSWPRLIQPQLTVTRQPVGKGTVCLGVPEGGDSSTRVVSLWLRGKRGAWAWGALPPRIPQGLGLTRCRGTWPLVLAPHLHFPGAAWAGPSHPRRSAAPRAFRHPVSRVKAACEVTCARQELALGAR